MKKIFLENSNRDKKIKHKIIYLLFFFVFVFIGVRAQTTIYATMDAYRDNSIDAGFSIYNDVMTLYLDNEFSGSTIVNYIGDVTNYGISECKAALKFSLPGSSLVVSSAKLKLKIIDVTSSPTITIKSTDDNDWEQSAVEMNSTFPDLVNSSTLVSGAAIVAGDEGTWKEFDITDFVESEISTSDHIISLVISGTSSLNNYFNFVADDDASGDKAELVLTFYPATSTFQTNGNWSTSGNWNNGLPGEETDVIINANCTLDQNAEVDDIIINAGKQLTINSGKTLNAGGNFTIKSNSSSEGSFIDNGTLSVSGTISVERYVSSNSSSHWEYISSPIPSASSDLFTSSSPTIRNLYYSNESTNSWSNYSTTSTGNLEVMRGYARKYVNGETGSDDVITFTGTSLNTGSLSISNLTGTTISSVFNGWNLVGNPYPSAIDWDASSGWSKSDFYNSYYVRTNGTYSSYAYDLGTHDATRYIPPMQAFWVRALSEGTFTLTCNNDVRVHSNQNIYKPASTDNTLHLSITNNTNGFDDDTYIRFKPEATENFDSQYDAYKMFADDINYPQIYTHADNDDYSINNLSNINGERNIPIGFKISVSGQFTITADLVSSFTDNGNTVFLEDTQENILQDLSVNNSYTFNSDATSGLSRFIIHFNPSITNITENTDEKVCIYSYQNEIHVKATEMLDGEISIYNMLGQIVSIKKLSGNNSAVISLDKECAVYTVKYTSDKKSITRRIIINR
ncbi:MAG TPA: DNRLRE domain-containing protein [Bacteroidales bacterium]|nr:DNRLRE domain-containing protein [Bacteroidales bacterium]